MLTKKQRDLLLFINQRMSQGDIAPSFEEMKDALGLKSKSGVHRLISALVERGYLERLPHRARAIEVKKLPPGFEDSADNNVVSMPQKPPIADQMASSESYELSHGSISLPLMGKIAAGTPIEAIRDEGNTIDIPPSLIGNGEYYALRVEGDSMINAGIHDKDIVVIRKTSTAHNGEIVVALVDDLEVTLKRFRRSGNRIILEPENDMHEPRVLEPERVTIQGTLASLMRQYH